MKYFIGIDPGLSGALAVVDAEGDLHGLYDLPVKYKYEDDRNTKRIIDGNKLKNIFIAIIAEHGAEELVVALEDVHGRGINNKDKEKISWGASVTFSLGETIGAIRTCVDLLGYNIVLISPTFWKKYFKLLKSKEAARELANKLYSRETTFFPRKADHNRAEALLIARYLSEIYKDK